MLKVQNAKNWSNTGSDRVTREWPDPTQPDQNCWSSGWLPSLMQGYFCISHITGILLLKNNHFVAKGQSSVNLITVRKIGHTRKLLRRS